MLSRLIRRLLGRPDPARSRPPIDPLAMQVAREQRHLAKRLSRITGKTPEELLDYERADRILASGRRR